MQTWRCLPQELWRHAAGLGAWLPQEIWSSGGMLRRCGRGGAWRCRGMNLWSSVCWNIRLSFLKAFRVSADFVSCQDILLAFIASSGFLLQVTFQPSFYLDTIPNVRRSPYRYLERVQQQSSFLSSSILRQIDTYIRRCEANTSSYTERSRYENFDS